jgi:hypothetical protein
MRAILCLFVLAAPAARGLAAPYGTSPYLTGMHDVPAPELLEGRGPCARGWVTELRYIGAGGVCPEAVDVRSLADRGYGIIMRLDFDGTHALPPEEGLRAGYAATFADCVARAQGVRVWIVGNEPNIAWGRVFSPDEAADIYLRVKAAVAGLPGGGEHQVLFPGPALWASVAPWGDWDDGLAAAIDLVGARGGSLGGLALHAYTREFSVAAISSDAWFPGREGKWHLHFRTYRDHLALLEARGILDIPLYITEAGNVCDPPCDPYPDQDLGYFVAMIEEIHAWNQAHPRQRIRAVTPYRWTRNDDGSGRDFCLGCSGPLQADLGRAVDLGRKWEEGECSAWNPVDADGDGGAPADGSTDGGQEEMALDGDGPAEEDADHPPDASAPDGDQGASSDTAGVEGGCGCAAAGKGPGLGWLFGLAFVVRRLRARVPRRAPRFAGPKLAGGERSSGRRLERAPAAKVPGALRSVVLRSCGLVALVAGGLIACARPSYETSVRSDANAAGEVSGRDRSPLSSGGERSAAVEEGAYILSLDLHRDDGCGETFVGVRSRGRLRVEVSRYGRSRLSVELNVEERSASRLRPAGGEGQESFRSWRRVYRWEGTAGFMGPSAQLHLTPVGEGCVHETLMGLASSGCPRPLPGLVVECNPARLDDSPVEIRSGSPEASGPRGGHVTCRAEVTGPRDKVELPPDLRVLSQLLLLTRDGRPDLWLRFSSDLGLIEGEIRAREGSEN